MPKKPDKVTSWCDKALVVSPIYFALCLNPKAFRRELKHLKVPHSAWPEFIHNSQSHGTTHHFERKGKRCAIVCVRDTHKHSAEAVTGLLIHEAVHIWQAIRDDLGEHKPSAEFEAYALQNISQELITKFSQLGGKYASRTQR